jgi:hypothetical protein
VTPGGCYRFVLLPFNVTEEICSQLPDERKKLLRDDSVNMHLLKGDELPSA